MQEAYRRDQVVDIINSVVAKVGANEQVSRGAIYKELTALQKIIADARAEMGASRAGDINEKHIPTATDELDAVVEATATATGEIMDACEGIEKELEKTPSEPIAAEVTKIYEACSFQDITGQRITNVVKTLKAIEEKVSNLLSALGAEDMRHAEEEDTRRGDEKLMNGPQAADKAISQDDIDKILESFD